jgi:hypothetical protein
MATKTGEKFIDQTINKKKILKENLKINPESLH